MILRLSLLILMLLVPVLTMAAPRQIHLEWEPDDDAITYELEIGELNKAKAFKMFKDIKLTEWKGELDAGHYWMRIRGRDDRGVPGDWSEKIEFQVTLQPVDVVKPAMEEIVQAGSDKENIKFEWKPMAAAVKYLFTLTDDNGNVIKSQEVDDTDLKVELPAAMKYTWTVQAIDRTGTPGAKPDTKPSFVLQGEALEKPDLRKPSSTFVRELELQVPKQAEVIKLEVTRYDKKTGEWKKVSSQEVKDTKSVPFKAQWPGGEYKVKAVAEGKYRAPSSVSEIGFDVESGSRSVEAEHRAILRKVIERTNSWYVTASWIGTLVNYEVDYWNSGHQKAALQVFTGTGQVGVGRYWKRSPFGFYASLDYGGMDIVPGAGVTGDKSRVQFLGAEASGLYRWAFGRSDVRLHLGAFHQQVPELVQATSTEIRLFDTTGTAFGGEYVYSISPKFVAQANLSARTVLLGESSVFHSKIKPDLNYQTGITGGMRLAESWTGLAGVSYRHQQYRFSNNAGKTNSILMSGPYLQLIMEYDF